MKITLNGNVVIVEEMTLEELILSKNLNPDKVIVEKNQDIFPRERFNEKIQDGDELEILRFVGGG